MRRWRLFVVLCLGFICISASIICFREPFLETIFTYDNIIIEQPAGKMPSLLLEFESNKINDDSLYEWRFYQKGKRAPLVIYPIGTIDTAYVLLKQFTRSQSTSVVFELMVLDPQEPDYTTLEPVYKDAKAIPPWHEVKTVSVTHDKQGKRLKVFVNGEMVLQYEDERIAALQKRITIPLDMHMARDRWKDLVQQHNIFSLYIRGGNYDTRLLYIPKECVSFVHRFLTISVYIIGLGCFFYVGRFRRGIAPWLLLVCVVAAHEIGLRWGEKDYCSLGSRLAMLQLYRDCSVFSDFYDPLEKEGYVKISDGAPTGRKYAIYPMQPEIGKKRIVFFGASPLLPLMNDTFPVFPKLVETYLNEGMAARYEVVNAGVYSISSEALFLYYTEVSKRLSPSIVILYLPVHGIDKKMNVSDLAWALKQYKQYKDNKRKLNALLTLKGAHTFVLSVYEYASYSYFFNALEYIRTILLQQWYVRLCIPHPSSLEYLQMIQFEYYREAQTESSHVLIIVPQCERDKVVHSEGAGLGVSAETRNELEKASIYIFPDLSDVLSHNTARYFADTTHFTQEGHRVVAEQLFNFMKEKKIVL